MPMALLGKLEGIYSEKRMGPLYICSRSLVVYGYDQYLLIPSNLYIHTTASLRKPHGVVTVLTCVEIKLKYIYYI